ncbi:[Nocardioides sp. WL0053]|uniref:Bifunctional uridylyltransferase/uridylyl-removing enzyme n=1 Tax=Nocardioides jiangsuensis TaxID=2866161 RepID=A0ABS7RL40_9ACTN|nr:[protein-PII] uridylyltransferase [Nocardioides jiangsuensis]MBY9075765.1 [protein-PII] uridylyltransferase [Nocardioides jiangsuensis]
MTSTERLSRADAADALCSAAFARALGERDETGLALVAVGGFGRRELAPHSDLDVVLVHTDDIADADLAEVAGTVWYPLWDGGAALDHSVRALSEVTAAAKQDIRVALGLLDARHLAGDPTVTLQLRSAVLAQWRRDARQRLPELREMAQRRGERLGELAHASVPDLKESGGGLRDATILTALVATWLVDVPHADLERSRQQLLDVRDAVHEVAGRPSDRIAPDMWDDLADTLKVADADEAQRQVREIGRRITHISRLTWRRVEGVLARPVSGAHRRRPDLEPVGSSLALSNGEVVLDRGARPADDPTLLLRAAAEAAERDLILAPPTAARLARECPPIPEPWPEEARNLLARLLAAGPGLLAVWETLDETGALHTLLPEWERVRLLPHASVVHRFTVDRHLVETCIEASRLIRRVSRPDLLVVAALLHDIGKGGLVEHSAAGEPIAAAIAARMGYSAEEVALLRGLVRWHLLLADVATTRDLEDPATVAHVVERVEDARTLELLAVLTEADARATAAKAWSPWRAGLVEELVARVAAELSETTPDGLDTVLLDIPPAVAEDSTRVDLRVETGEHGSQVTVVSGDRVGLLAAVAGMLGMQRVSIRSARAWTQDEYAVSQWQVDDTHLDAAVLRQRLEAVLAGRLDPGERLRRTAGRTLDPSVAVRPEASREATVLEVRVDDRPGVVHLVCQALADIDVSVRSAHVTTLGPQAVDVFYVQETAAGALGDERSAEAAHAVRHALTGPATLDA